MYASRGKHARLDPGSTAAAMRKFHMKSPEGVVELHMLGWQWWVNEELLRGDYMLSEFEQLFNSHRSIVQVGHGSPWLP